MTKIPFEAPEFRLTSFNCPFCNAFSEQKWYFAANHNGYRNYSENVKETEFCFCTHCKEYSIWQGEVMIYPDSVGLESPNEDLDEDIKNDYMEAASIYAKSPRGSAALLRLALQKLCIQLGEKGKDINTDVKNLVAKGLSKTIQQALDTLRVVGNEAVHPGQLDLNDKPETAAALFRLLNKIAETMISEPRQIQEIYDTIPEKKKQAIKERDGAN